MAMTLDSDIRAMANRLLNTRPDASAAEALRKAAGMLIDLANERAKAQPAQAVDVGAIREVIAALRTWRDEGTDSMARKLTKAIAAPPSNSPTTGAIGENGNG